MEQSDVFSKLSRIFETHDLGNIENSNGNDDDIDLYALIGEERPEHSYNSSSPRKNSPSPLKNNQSNVQGGGGNIYKPTPFEVWKSKQKISQKKPTPKLNGQQWDSLVDKMHSQSRTKQSYIVKDQNESLAAELGVHAFKPNINKKSSDLACTMKPLHERMPEMIDKKEKLLHDKRLENDEAEKVECTGRPVRSGSKVSDMLLKKQGRDLGGKRRFDPNDFYKYASDKEKRNDMRRQILDEIEDKELTFRPIIGDKSRKLQEKLIRSNVISKDPVTKNSVVAPSHFPKQRIRTAGLQGSLIPRAVSMDMPGLGGRTRYGAEWGEEPGLEVGPAMVIESEHPYRHNISEYTTVSVPGAVSYKITFDEDTRTEAVFDYIRFYDDETHSHHLGCGKYSGGHHLPHNPEACSPCNWPGVTGRPPLLIQSSKFVIHFKTNGSVNDWGFRMFVTPTLLSAALEELEGAEQGGVPESPYTHQPSSSSIPSITHHGRNHQGSNQNPGTHEKPRPIHDRLYQAGLDKKLQQNNEQADLLSRTIKNVNLKPWETSRAALSTKEFAKEGYTGRTHLPKQTLADAMEELLLPPPPALANNSSFRSMADQGEMEVSEMGVGLGMNDEEAAQVAEYNSYYTAIAYDDTLRNLWKDLTTQME